MSNSRNKATKNLDPRIISLFKKAGKKIGFIPKWVEDVAQEAARFLKYDEVVALLKSEDFFQIYMETIFFDSLSDEDEEPYHSLEEWETILELYIIFLVDNRDHIFEAGYPQNNFNQCPWLDLGYSNFYPTVCSLDFLSRWNDLEDDMPSNLGTKKVRLLSSKNAKIVENDRSTLYDLKILILYTLLAAVT